MKPDWTNKDGTAQLYHGDCIEVMQQLLHAGVHVDVVLTDPPYGHDLDYDGFDDSLENVRALAKQWLPLARKLADSVAFTCGHKAAKKCYPLPDHVGCWLMEAGGYNCSWGYAMWQPILCYGKDRYLSTRRGPRPDVVRTNGIDRDKPDHPCPKPLQPWLQVVKRFSLLGDVVLDPFNGSGTTAVACIKLGRRYIGIEQSEKYFEDSCRRVAPIKPMGSFGIEQRPGKKRKSAASFGVSGKRKKKGTR